MSLLSPVLRGALCAAALVLAAGAAVVPLDTSNPSFSDEQLNDGDTATDGSIVLTFGDVLNLGGGNDVRVDGDGMFLGDDFPNRGVSFSIVFDTDTLIDQYTVGFLASGVTGGFQLAGANGTSGLNDMGSLDTCHLAFTRVPGQDREPVHRRGKGHCGRCPTLTQMTVGSSTNGWCRLRCGLRSQVPAG